MTDQELKDLVASLAIQSAKTDEQLAKNAIQSAKTDEQLAKNAIQSAKTDEQLAKNAIQFAKTDAQLAKTDAKLEKSAAEFNKGMDRLQKSQDKTDAQIAKTDAQLAKNAIQFAETNATFKKLGIFTKNMNQKVEGISKSTGEEAQEFFLSSLEKDTVLGGVEFDRILGDVLMRFKGQCHQMDVFLANGNSVGIVEVKHKVRTDDIEQLKNIVAKFHQFYPQFKSYKIIPALAGKIFPKHLQDKTLKAGFVVLTQQGDHIEQRLP